MRRDQLPFKQVRNTPKVNYLQNSLLNLPVPIQQRPRKHQRQFAYFDVLLGRLETNQQRMLQSGRRGNIFLSAIQLGPKYNSVRLPKRQENYSRTR